jgi:hypothetical protein
MLHDRRGRLAAADQDSPPVDQIVAMMGGYLDAALERAHGIVRRPRRA